MTATAPTGYRTKVRTVELVCDWASLEPEEGAPPLTVTVVKNLTFDAINAIPNPYIVNPDGDGVLIQTTPELQVAIAPWVLAWNCEALDLKTGQMMPVPPPAEMGADAFRVVDWLIAPWIADKLRNVHRLVDPGKDKPLAFSDETSGGDSSD